MTFEISGKLIGSDQEPFIILEAGINHNGEIDKAEQMIKAAKAAGADAIKFQTFKASEFIADSTQLFTYKSQGEEVTEPMLEMFERYEFSSEEWFKIKSMCDDAEILFLSTPQNKSDLDLLLEIGIPAIKVGSDDFTNLPLLAHYCEQKIPLIMSCGMADLGEVYDAIYATQALAKNEVLLMLCTSQYPTPPEDVNIAKLQTIAGAFDGLPLGFSDHTQGTVAATLAVGLGAVAFEKHFTLSRELPGPDHWFSESPKSATEWVHAIRCAHKMIGSSEMVPTTKELDMRNIARRSIIALKDIKVGEVFNEENIGLMRPGTGLSPKMIDHFLGQKSRNDINKTSQLKFTDIA